ncbi:hypothetical protein TIFTF001_017493 [Ficus carica]|uniref:Kinesin-like protein n=1 Tax=Ficus carica TaxID=3494 RepID=A0AA88A854_FICCA|nr:hypothetical protein TIFTF001_017493 [Ficus carica]
MSHMKVCVRFRPLSSRERRDYGDSVCVQCVDSETFNLKDEKDEIFTFSFDKVFYENSEQASVFEFLALPIVRDAVNGINGTIITYGQTGAGKTYSMEGPGILECDELKKGLLPRVVDGIFECIKSSEEATKYSVKLSMVEIYMERVRDLFDLTKDNIQIKENKAHGIILHGVTDISIADPAEALRSLASGIANRVVGETRMVLSSSCCVKLLDRFYWATETLDRAKTGKLLLVDLAGSEKAEKTGAEGSVLEQAKTINKSLSALGNVINALTCGSLGKSKHIPYRDSKVTRILQDALGGKSQIALLCCCSSSPSNASETLSTLRASHVKVSMPVKCIKDEAAKKWGGVPSPTKDGSMERILNKLRERLDNETVDLLEELFIVEKVFFNLNSEEDSKAAYEDCVLKKISSLQQAEEELALEVEELKMENKILKDRISAPKKSRALFKLGETSGHLAPISLVKGNEDKSAKRYGRVLSPTKDESRNKIILNELGERLNVEDVEFLEELFVQEGILLDPNSEGYKSGSLELVSAYGDDVTLRTIQLLQHSGEELELEAEKLWIANKALRDGIVAAKRSDALRNEARENSIFGLPKGELPSVPVSSFQRDSIQHSCLCFWPSFVDLQSSPLHMKFHSPSHSSELVSRVFHQFLATFIFNPIHRLHALYA